MSKVNTQVVANTKLAIDAVLDKLKKNSDKFVNQLVELKPNEFSSENNDSALDPFVIIAIMTTDLARQFDEFREALGMTESNVKPLKKGNNDPTSH